MHMTGRCPGPAAAPAGTRFILHVNGFSTQATCPSMKPTIVRANNRASLDRSDQVETDLPLRWRQVAARHGMLGPPSPVAQPLTTPKLGCVMPSACDALCCRLTSSMQQLTGTSTARRHCSARLSLSRQTPPAARPCLPQPSLEACGARFHDMFSWQFSWRFPWQEVAHTGTSMLPPLFEPIPLG